MLKENVEEVKERVGNIMKSSSIAYKPKLSSPQFKREAMVPEGQTAAVTDGALSGREGFVISLRRQGPVFNLKEIYNRPRW